MQNLTVFTGVVSQRKHCYVRSVHAHSCWFCGGDFYPFKKHHHVHQLLEQKSNWVVFDVNTLKYQPSSNIANILWQRQWVKYLFIFCFCCLPFIVVIIILFNCWVQETKNKLNPYCYWEWRKKHFNEEHCDYLFFNFNFFNGLSFECEKLDANIWLPGSCSF